MPEKVGNAFLGAKNCFEPSNPDWQVLLGAMLSTRVPFSLTLLTQVLKSLCQGKFGHRIGSTSHRKPKCLHFARSSRLFRSLFECVELWSKP